MFKMKSQKPSLKPTANWDWTQAIVGISLFMNLLIGSLGQSQIIPWTYPGLGAINNILVSTPGDTELHTAVSLGDYLTLQQLIINGSDINAVNSRMETPLHRAALFPDKPVALVMIRSLIDNGTDPYLRDDRSYTFLHNVVTPGTTISPLEFHQLTEYLDAKGLVKLFNNHLDSSAGGETVLQMAVKNVPEVNPATLRFLQQNGVSFRDEDRIGDNILTYAIMGGKNVTFLQQLIELGADYQHVNEENRSLLHYAAYYGNLTSLDFLSDLGLTDVNGVDNLGMTPAHFSALSGNGGQVLDTMQYLIQNGADVNIRDRSGVTPLDMVLRWGDWVPGRDTVVGFLTSQFNIAT